jgi:hypothetical protein
MLAVVVDQHQLALQHKDELIFLLMPVTQGGVCPRLKGEVIDAKLGYAKKSGEPLLMFAFEPLWPLRGRKGARRGRSNLTNVAIGHELSQMIS